MEEKVDWEEEVSLFDLINVLLKRKWVILAVTFIVLALSFLAWRFMPQTYKAEFEVSYRESSLPSEFKGEVAVQYYGKNEPVKIPYSFSLPPDSHDSPKEILSSFSKGEKLSEILQGEPGILPKGASSIPSVSTAPKEEGKFLVTVRAQERFLCQRTAELLSSRIEEELFSALQSRHEAKVKFFQDLLKRAEESYKEAREKFFEFSEQKDPFEIDRKLQELDSLLQNLQKRRDELQAQINISPISFPLPPEALSALSFASLERLLNLKNALDSQYRKELEETTAKIDVLREEKKALEKEKRRQSILLDEYNLLLRDYTFWREINSLLTLSLPPTLEDGSYPFDGEVEIGEVTYSGTERSLKLNLAVGLVAGLFVGVLVAFFWEFWERGKEARR